MYTCWEACKLLENYNLLPGWNRPFCSFESVVTSQTGAKKWSRFKFVVHSVLCVHFSDYFALGRKFTPRRRNSDEDPGLVSGNKNLFFFFKSRNLTFKSP